MEVAQHQVHAYVHSGQSNSYNLKKFSSTHLKYEASVPILVLKGFNLIDKGHKKNQC